MPAVRLPVQETPAPVPVARGVVRKPAEVAGLLQSAGIIVRLPELPSANTPASVLFAPHTPVEPEAPQEEPAKPEAEADAGFAWLQDPPKERETPSSAPAPVPVIGANGLPKRVPKGQLRGPARGQQPQPPTATRDAVRARGFLNGFQAGIRKSENRKGETSS
jgi:hypothetical protein